MAHNIILHIQGEEPILAEVDELPDTADLMVKVHNPRRIDGKDLSYLSENVITVYYPAFRINFIEILPTREEEEIIGFVRE
jgi:hypothetical protein